MKKGLRRGWLVVPSIVETIKEEQTTMEEK